MDIKNLIRYNKIILNDVIPIMFKEKNGILMRIVRFTLICLLIFSHFSCKNDPLEINPQFFTWSISSPAAQGMDSKLLDSASIKAGELGYVDGFLVIKNGYLISEKYYNGYNSSSSHNVKSVSKSFLSAMIGIALKEGIIKNLDEKIMKYFPEYVYSGMDERKNNITIQHLLTMTMGIDKEENNLLQVFATNNWVKTTIELPLLSSPGEKFRYNTLETHLLSVILTRSSGMSLLDFARKNLTIPMGIDIRRWDRDPQGYYIGGTEMYFTPREMAVLGYLYLNNGKLNGIQIVPEDWIKISLTKNWPKDSQEWGVLRDYNYGYLWWIGKINGYEMFWALGFAGQMIITFPALNLIVVTTADYNNLGWEQDQERPILEIVSKYVLPAVNDHNL
jgi:CubicO group peptidase (beta-lactamase class C family)